MKRLAAVPTNRKADGRTRMIFKAGLTHLVILYLIYAYVGIS